MALSTINGQDGTGAISINSVVYSCILAEFEFEATVAQVDSTTFCSEANTVYEPGETVRTLRIAGLLKKGAAAAGPLEPPPQNVPVVLTFSTGCTLTGNVNFTRAVARRTVKQNAILAGEALYTGSVTKVWDTGS
jgi:hypothetical protein